RHAARQAAAEAPRYDVQRGILIAGKVDPEAAEALYQGLARSEAPKFDLDSFRTYLERQAAAIRTRTGCEQVQFRLAEEDGKLKLKARPVGEAAG
ncbi:MAG TPA: MXAN_5187 C-terminal domain-containing protein, partial [Thermoanaerobaculia bacterium]|nr:MXAN_5187 C-terminal domain-containing protein [Thermoanaerobaculia bacterium]